MVFLANVFYPSTLLKKKFYHIYIYIYIYIYIVCIILGFYDPILDIIIIHSLIS